VIFTPTHLQDAVIIDVERRGDERGFLARVFCESEFAEHGPHGQARHVAWTPLPGGAPS
jgi:dTDP-4-dehydrorhamnose 3,5-epimerase-like enzyme